MSAPRVPLTHRPSHRGRHHARPGARPGALGLALCLLFMSWSLAHAAGEVVVVVPYAQSNPTLPHPAHSGAPITLKAIVRNATCNFYQVRWDTDRDGDFADEAMARYPRDTYTRILWDIGRTFRVPVVPREVQMVVNVQVKSECDQSEHYGAYRLFVHAFEPAADPRQWTDDQVEVLGAMALDEVLWFLHRRMVNLRNFDAVNILGRPNRSDVPGLQVWLNAINDHQPAWPPGTIQPNAGQSLPDGWAAANDRRWRTDPYAEDSARLLNHFLASATVFRNIPAADEEDTCGYDAEGAPLRCPRLPGTTDGRGIHIGSSSTGNHVYLTGINLGSIAPVLPALAGTPIRHGNAGIRGQTWEWLTQQMTDFLGNAQIDSGCGRGGWYYYSVDDGNCSQSDASAVQWAHIGLESAEVAGRPYGVVVSNRHKFRLVDNFIRNQAGDGGSRYRTDRNNGSTMQLTGGALVGARWLGVHDFSADDATVPFPDESVHTRAQLRTAYDRYLQYTVAQWPSQRRQGNAGWQDGNWRLGSHLCGDTRSGAYPSGLDRCGNTYSMYSFQKGFRTGEPELLNLAGIDWYRQFATYYVRAQTRAMSDANPWQGYEPFGEMVDDYCERTNATCSYSQRSLTPMMAGLVLTPTIFNAKPFAVANVSPSAVVAGCIGGAAGRVTFEHRESFHPNDDARFIAFQWDLNAQDGLWWETGFPPDHEEMPDADGHIVGSFEHVYRDPGEYTATLRVIDDRGLWRSTRVAVSVSAAPNVAPSLQTGGPYAVERGAPLQLSAQVDDPNVACGDRVSVAWDLDNDGQTDFVGANPLVPAAFFDDVPTQTPQLVRVTATDEAGATTMATTHYTVYRRDPVAIAQVHPNPAACGQEVVFDATASHHTDPRRSLVQHDWDLDGEPGFDAAGRVVSRRFERFGAWPVRLRVMDDRGRMAERQLNLAVNVGNRAPTAAVARRHIVAPIDQAVTLDGRPSSDPDGACGDRIVDWRWDVNGDGDYDDPIDRRGALVNLDPAVVLAVTGGIGAPPHALILEVTDSLGRTHAVELTLVVVDPQPVPVLVQDPAPAVIDPATGRVQLVLDGRGSRSPLPDVTLVDWVWDLDDDGRTDLRGPALTTWTHVFQPIPDPNRLPVRFVRMQVVDSEGRTQTVRRQLELRVGPTPPTARAAVAATRALGGYHILEGEPLRLDGSESTDPNVGDRVVLWSWDLAYEPEVGFEADLLRPDADGDRAEAVTEVPLAVLAEHGLDVAGQGQVALRVEDTTGLSALDAAAVFVHPTAPVVGLEIARNPVAPQETVRLDASSAHHPHPGIHIVSIAWDVDGDGVFSANQPFAPTPAPGLVDAPPTPHGSVLPAGVVEVVYPQFTFDGPIRVAVRVTDSRGQTAEDHLDVFVTEGNRPPVPQAGGHRDPDSGAVEGPYVLLPGEALPVSAVGSFEPDAAFGDAIVAYRWDLDADGVPERSGSEPVPAPIGWAELVEHGLGGIGDHTITLTVVDRFGAESTGEARVRVVRGPEAHISAPNRAACGDLVTLDGRPSTTDGPVSQGFQIVLWDWDLDGDGQFDDAEGPVVTVPAIDRPPVAGEPGFDPLVPWDGRLEVWAGLRISDALGHTAVSEKRVLIDLNNLPPVAHAGGPYTTGPYVGADGQTRFVPVLLDGRRASDPNAPCDDPVVYHWDTDGDGRFGAAHGDLEGPVVAFTDPTWRVGTTRSVALVVCDRFGVCSTPAEALIEVLAEAPPAGAIATPGVADCVGVGTVPGGGAGNIPIFSVTLDVADPEGDPVDVRVEIANRTVATSLAVPTVAGGAPVRVALTVPVSEVPEGRHHITVYLDDNRGGTSQVTSHGRVTFDRSPPALLIGVEPASGACYAAENVPVPPLFVWDRFDLQPEVQRRTLADSCERTLVVRAIDACGNATEVERRYRVAEPVDLVVEGPPDHERVAEARYGWSIQGALACASGVTATVRFEGGAEQPYPEESLINTPGTAVVTVRAFDCAGRSRDRVRTVRINRPPVALPAPDGTVAADDDALYVASEGDPLVLDGRDSRPPEFDDLITAWQWDFDADGVWDDAVGPRPTFPTSDHGRFLASLRVTDDLGANDMRAFVIRVDDVHPVVDAGGPYAVDQGKPITFDASNSRPGAPVDAITRYVWDFGDGTVVEGLHLIRPTHVYRDDGRYEVSLTVHDEDSHRSARVPVVVHDVDPIILEVKLPEDPRELYTLQFGVKAVAGAPGDPIVRIEWDFDDDGRVDAAGPAVNLSRFYYLEPGQYTVRVRVRDPDSFAEVRVPLEVRQVDFSEVITWVGIRVEEKIQDLPELAAFALGGIEESIEKGLWGERWGQRGNTLLAVESMVYHLRGALGGGAHLGEELWALSRQQWRALQTARADLMASADAPAAGNISLGRADLNLAMVEGLWNAPEGLARHGDPSDSVVAEEIWYAGYEAWFWLMDSVDACSQDYNRFRMPDEFDPLRRTQLANGVNAQLKTAFVVLREQLNAYEQLGAAQGDHAPGLDQVYRARGHLGEVIRWLEYRVGNMCDSELFRCLTDAEALGLLLEAAELVSDLAVAEAHGVYVRNWQTCTMLGVRFRSELSILRTEFVCGPFHWTSQLARRHQATAISMLDEGRNAEALSYYADGQQTCMLREIYNECLVPFTQENLPVGYPPQCINQLQREAQRALQNGGADQ